MSEEQPGVEADGPSTEQGTTAEEVPGFEQFRFQPPLVPPQSTAPMGVPIPEQTESPTPTLVTATPAEPADRLRAATVAVLNLSGLGLGYVLLRRWLPAALCWIATGILLLIALPVDPNGVPGALLVLYLIGLVYAAVNGALRARRTPLTWQPRSPQVALALAVVLLAVPVGGAVLYGQAHMNAVQQMLLGRLSDADQVLTNAEGESFADAQPQYDTAVATYRDLLDNNRSSQAGQLVPGRLAAFYQTVAAPYAAQDYCGAIAPLTYLRGVSGTFAAGALGSLATWPDDRLATSLYQCGVTSLGAGGDTTTTDLNELLSTFPASAQAGKVAPAVASAINTAAAGIAGSNPCKVTTTLQTLGTQASALTSSTAEVSDALRKDAATATADVESGTYACGVSQYKGGNFDDAETTMDGFASTYPQDPNKALAQNFSIAAQIAQEEPAAGKVVPTLASGGSVQVTIVNDSPDALDILYTGGVTGTVHLAACGKCSTYPSDAAGQQEACSDSGINYPQATISLQAGTTYYLQKNTDSTSATPDASSEQYSAGNAYEDCTFETSIFGSLL